MAKELQGNNGVLYQYTPEQRAKLEAHIEQYFGPISFLLKQPVNKDIQLDIAVIEPSASRKRNFYTLVTIGLGAYKMPLPSNYDLDDYEALSNQLDRCELVMMLEPSFKIPSANENHYWPIRLMKEIAHLPFEKGTFLDWGVCYTNNEPFAPHTKLSHALICGLNKIYEPKSQGIILGEDFDVGFYLVMPLYRQEYRVLLEIAGIDANATLDAPIANEYLNKFISRMRFIEPLVSNGRNNGSDTEAEYWAMTCEDYRWHQYTIDDKNLKIEPINALNHIAVLFHFMIEKNMLSADFIETFSEISDRLTRNENVYDIRDLLHKELVGTIDRRFFNESGIAFLNHYLNRDMEIAPRYTADIDSYALRYFGVEKYYCKEFDTEAYLHIPFTPQYYSDMKSVMEQRMADFAEQHSQVSYIDEQTYIALQRFLDCETQFFPKLQNDCPIKSRLNYNYRSGAVHGFIPVVIEVQPCFLEIANNIIDNLNPNLTTLKKLNNDRSLDAEDLAPHNIERKYVKQFGINSQFVFEQNKVKAVRYNCMSTPDIMDGSYLTAKRLEQMFESGDISRQVLNDYQQLKDKFVKENELISKKRDNHKRQLKAKDGLGLLCSYNAYERAHICLGALDKADNINLYSYWDENTSYTKPVLVANIPVDDPTMILPYLSFLYPSDDSLVPLEMVELAKHFWLHYRAIPAVISLSGIEFITCAPLSDLMAQMLAYDILLLGDYLPKEDVARSLTKTLPELCKLLKGKNSFFLPVITPRNSDFDAFIEEVNL